jgi:hypothetical protein
MDPTISNNKKQKSKKRSKKLQGTAEETKTDGIFNLSKELRICELTQKI